MSVTGTEKSFPNELTFREDGVICSSVLLTPTLVTSPPWYESMSVCARTGQVHSCSIAAVAMAKSRAKVMEGKSLGAFSDFKMGWAIPSL
jgi:hypothetical protein